MMSKDLVREYKLPDGRIMREHLPLVYGYTLTMGPDGKPVIREFSNVKPTGGRIAVKEEREPLVDIMSSDSELKVIVELPGINKEESRLQQVRRSSI